MSARRELAISPAFHPWICEEVMISKLTYRLIDTLLTQSRSPMWRSLDRWSSHRQTRTCPSSLDLYWRCICTKWSRSRNPVQSVLQSTHVPTNYHPKHRWNQLHLQLTIKTAWFMMIHSSGLAGFHEMPVPLTIMPGFTLAIQEILGFGTAFTEASALVTWFPLALPDGGSLWDMQEIEVNHDIQ